MVFPVSLEGRLGIAPGHLPADHSCPSPVSPDTPDLPDFFPVLLIVSPQIVVGFPVEAQSNRRNLRVSVGNVVVLPRPVNRRRGVGRVYGCFVLVVG